MEFKIGDLVQVIRGKSKGMIGHVNEVKGDCVFVVRNQEDLNKGLVPAMGDFNDVNLMKIYTDDELRYAAYATCPCGAGLAYPKEPIDLKTNNCWDCSDIITGRALVKDPDCKVVHTGKLPFAFYEIKSEDQPSANGATTRPKKD